MLRQGTRAQVMHGTALKTTGGLRRNHLKYNKQGKIVSKKMSDMAKKENRLQKAGYVTRKNSNKIISGGRKSCKDIDYKYPKQKCPSRCMPSIDCTRYVIKTKKVVSKRLSDCNKSIKKKKNKAIKKRDNKVECDIFNNSNCIISNKYEYSKFLYGMEIMIKPILNKYLRVGLKMYLDDEPQIFPCPRLNAKKLFLKVSKKLYNGVYVVDVDKSKNYKKYNLYFDGNIDIVFKKCDLDTHTCFYTKMVEIDTAIKYSKLVINYISNSFLFFFGITNTCVINLDTSSLRSDTLSSKINVDSDESLIFSNYVYNSNNIKSVCDRQLFEYLYSMFCSIANYGFFVTDRNSGNYLTYNDTSGIVYIYEGKKIYFNSTEALCIIDYQAIKTYYSSNEKISLDTTIDITDEVSFIKSFCKTSATYEKVGKQRKVGSIKQLLSNLYDIFEDNLTDLTEFPKNTKIFEFKLLVE